MSFSSSCLMKSGAYVISALVASMAVVTSVQASPYHTTGLDAADRPEIKIGAEYETTGDEREIEGPALDLTLPIKPGLETSVTFGPGWVKEERGFSDKKGWLDTEVAVKWEIIPVPKEGGFGLTTEPALFIPTGTNGVGDNEWQFEIPVIVGWEKGRTSIRAFAAYGASFESHDDELGFGSVIEYDLTERLSVGAEVSGETPLSHSDGYELSGDVGFKYDLGNDFELQARFSHSLHTPDHVASKGIALYLEKAF